MASSRISKPGGREFVHRLSSLFLRRHAWFVRIVWGALFLFTLVVFTVSVPFFF